MTNITMRQMLEAGVHFGHRKRFWNPKMAPFIFGKREGIHIINLEKTLPMFRDAVQFVGKLAANRGRILFVGTKHAAREIIKEEAIRCGMPYVDYRWLGGMLTNYKTIRQSIKRLKELEELFATEQGLRGMTKKEMLTLMREKEKLSACLEGIKNMGGLPDAIFVIDVAHEKIALQEAKRLRIPVIGVVDTNTSPDDVDYLIPGNDDAMRSIRLYCKTMADTIIEARGVLDLKEAKEKPKAAKEEAPVVKKVVKKKAVQKEESSAAEAEPAKAKPAKKKAATKTAAAKTKTTAKAKAKTEAEKPAEKKVAKKKTARAKTTKAAAKKTEAVKTDAES